MIYNILRIVIGLVLLMPALLISFFIGGQENNQPWCDGLIKNTLRAYKRYTARSWLRRIAYLFKNPRVVDQYLKILINKQEIEYVGEVAVYLDYLIPSHDTQTTHKHHRARVEQYKQNKQVNSFSPIIVVDNFIHDGHHRVEAMREAGIAIAMVSKYVSKR